MAGDTLFISDCHLHPARPETTAALLGFLDHRAAGAARLYILGDLFEVWLGDDDDAEPALIAALRRLSARTEVRFMAGNRDFLLGDEFARRVGMQRIADPATIELGGRRVALLHGDTLCTDDHDYQAFRELVRGAEWQADFLARPLAERRRIAAGLRRDSGEAMAQKPMTIMDVNPDTVAATFDRLGVDTIVHGHTHRPAAHRHGTGRRRFVLGDWNPGPSYLRCDDSGGFELVDPRV